MRKPAIIIGMGEMGGVFSRGLLRTGTPVFPVLRGDDFNEIMHRVPDPGLVLVAVGEADLHATLDGIPNAWRPHLALLQNELLPRDWEAHAIPDPTVISVWFEKKKGQDYKVLIPSPVFGPKTPLLVDALTTLAIPTQKLSDITALLFQLVCKNVYILTTNIAGLITDGTVEQLWHHHEQLARAVANEVIDIQERLIGGTALDREALIAGMLVAIQGDLNHRCKGRSAPARLVNAIRFADQAQLDVPKLREIQALQH